MADEITKRTTSFAKTVEGLVQEQNSLDRVEPLREDFSRAAEAQEPKRQQTEKEQFRQNDERKPDHAPAPGMSLKPKGPIRISMDKKIDYEKLRKINAAAKERTKAAERSRSMSRDFERER